MDYQKIAKDCRIRIIKLLTEKKAAFIGSSFSSVDLLVVLYHGFMNIGSQNYSDNNRALFFMGKGHAASGLYAVLESKGLITPEDVDCFCKEDCTIGVHPKKGSLPGVEASTGSLGHALGLACGVALSNRINNIDSRVFVLLGDGECNEGSVWEAVMFAAKQKLTNMITIIDRNRLQSYGFDKDVLDMGDMAEKFRAFGMNTIEIDGHDYAQISNALEAALKCSDKPVVIVANTVKGKGVSFMENQVLWHYKWPDEKLLEQGLKELI